MRLVLVSLIHTNLQFHYMRHSTIELSLLHLKRFSKTQTFSYWVPELHGTGYFMRSECQTCGLVSFTLSAACALVLSSYINVCAGYMCFVKL